MNTRLIDTPTVWAVLVMETGVALALVSLPAQGERLVGTLPALLLALLLPLGYLAVRLFPSLRDPSWRLPLGICLAVLVRAIVSEVPAAGLLGLLMWFGRGVFPTVLGVALWWRGGAVFDAEMTASEVRNEFGVLVTIMLAILALIRPFLLPDVTLLGVSVGLVAVGGLLATALSRQDAANAGGLHLRRTLSTTTALLPAGAAVVLVGFLRPTLLSSMWSTLGYLIELVLTPIGLLIAWLLSLFPRGEVRTATPPQYPINTLAPNPAALADLQERTAWIGTVIGVALLLVAAITAIIVVRILLATWIRSPLRSGSRPAPELAVESAGTPRADAGAALGWLLRWLGRLVGLGRPHRGAMPQLTRHAEPVNAWAAYRRLLEWAEHQGLGRRPAESTGQLQARLVQHAPAMADTVSLVTSTYEVARYGEVDPPQDRMHHMQAAVEKLDVRS